MKLENTIKRLIKDGFVVVMGQFDFKDVWMCQGTALIDLQDGVVTETTARYVDILSQILNNKSHITTVENRKQSLSKFNKLGC